jgi:DNA-directed RNA polymerase alpha subunit
MPDYPRLVAALASELERRCSPSEQPACLQTARHLLQSDALLTPLERLELPTAVVHALQRAGHASIETVARLSAAQLEAVRHLGPSRRQQLQLALTHWLTTHE